MSTLIRVSHPSFATSRVPATFIPRHPSHSGTFGEIGPPRATECAAGRGLHPSPPDAEGTFGGVGERPSHDAQKKDQLGYGGSAMGPA
jgi:hypothetical protein